MLFMRFAEVTSPPLRRGEGEVALNWDVRQYCSGALASVSTNELIEGLTDQAFLPTLVAFAKSRSSSGAETPGASLRQLRTYRKENHTGSNGRISPE